MMVMIEPLCFTKARWQDMSRRCGLEVVSYPICILTLIRKKSISYMMNTQILVTSSTDVTITVRTELIYNNMFETMYEFNKAPSNPFPKSLYRPIYKLSRNAEHSRQWEN